MRVKNLWLTVFIWCMLLGGLVTCAGMFGSDGDSEGVDIDLEAVAELYKEHLKSGAQDLSTFENAVNDKKLYQGEGRVTCALGTDGAVFGFVDGDADKAYSAGKDRLVFKLEADKPRKDLIVSDAHNHHYRLGVGDILGVYLLSRMFTRHHTYYGGWHNYGYRSYVPRGYYRSYRSSRRSGSGGRSRGWGRSSGSSGGWGGGK